jgi:hypothetical protein
VVTVLNLIGATLAGGSPLYLKDYLDYLSEAHKVVLYNRADLNPQITSWNRLLFSLGGPLVELTVITTLAGYLVWGGVVFCRCAISGWPGAAWTVAAAACGGPLCSQVLGYEAYVLVLAVPWVRDLFAAKHLWQAIAAVGLLFLQQLPSETFDILSIDFHRPLGVALFALLVLVGPSRPLETARDAHT